MLNVVYVTAMRKQMFCFIISEIHSAVSCDSSDVSLQTQDQDTFRYTLRVLLECE